MNSRSSLFAVPYWSRQSDQSLVRIVKFAIKGAHVYFWQIWKKVVICIILYPCPLLKFACSMCSAKVWSLNEWGLSPDFLQNLLHEQQRWGPERWQNIFICRLRAFPAVQANDSQGDQMCKETTAVVPASKPTGWLRIIEVCQWRARKWLISWTLHIFKTFIAIKTECFAGNTQPLVISVADALA